MSKTTTPRVWLTETGECFHESAGCMGGNRIRTPAELADVAALTDREPCTTCVDDATVTVWRRLGGETTA